MGGAELPAKVGQMGGAELHHCQTRSAEPPVSVAADHPEHPDNQYTPFPSFPPSGDANELHRVERWQRHQQRPLEEYNLNTRADPWSGLAEVRCSWQLGCIPAGCFQACQVPGAVRESCLGQLHAVSCFAAHRGQLLCLCS